MKIEKIIISDELPQSCNICPFSLQDDGEYFCCAREILEEEHALTMLNMIHVRPDWCPLMSWEEYEKELDAGLDVYLGLDGLIESEDE